VEKKENRSGTGEADAAPEREETGSAKRIWERWES